MGRPVGGHLTRLEGDCHLVSKRIPFGAHPNIVQLRAFEENNGNPYLVMDYVDGETLDEYLAEHIGTTSASAAVNAPAARSTSGTAAVNAPAARSTSGTGGSPVLSGLPESEVIRLLKPIAAALDYAHSEGVVHRDVKPANVMIRKDGHPYILDFGIAREIQETMTRVTGKLSSGTLLYMSPEQLRGQPPKPAQDIYSFASMAYECLTGEPPFSRGQVEYQILNEQPPPLPSDTRLAASIMRGLSKAPEARPDSCTKVVLPVSAVRRTPPPQPRLANRPPARPLPKSENSAPRTNSGTSVAVVVIGCLVAVLFLFLCGVMYRADQEQKAERIRQQEAERQAEDEQGEAHLGLEQIQVDIADKNERIAEMLSEIAVYREDPDGFETHIANVDAQRKIADGVNRSPETFAEAKAALKTLEDAARVIQRECSWLKVNKSARDEARQIELEIVRDIVPMLERFRAGEYASVTCAQGESLRKDGNAALSKGQFLTATTKLSEAHLQLAAAAAEAKGLCIDAHLRTAKKWSAASKWQQCVEECDTVLGWDATNAEAKKLKAGAESNLVSTAKVVVKVNGMELKDGEKVRIGSTLWKTPIVWGAKNIKKGSRYGAEVAYEKNGRCYLGRLDDFTVDWRGPRTFTVALKECTGPKHGDVKTLTLPGSAKMEMIYVGPGTFTMGSPSSEEGRVNDESLHRVTLTKGFWLGKYEVTQKQWQSVMEANPSHFKGDNLPVESVSWNDCREFVQKVNDAVRRQFGGGARLPTEAEWEYACRAGTSGAYAGTGRLDDMGWYWDNSGGMTHPVGQKRPNAWGFYDMHGNVYEWCSDRYGSYEGDTTNPIGAASGVRLVLRGGGWSFSARDCRSAYRNWLNPGYRGNYYGFRLCCSAGVEEKDVEPTMAETTTASGRVPENYVSRSLISIGSGTRGGAGYGDARTEACVMKVLWWLKAHQKADGSWDGGNKLANTALATLTYLAHGEYPGSPSPYQKDFGPVVEQAINYLVNCVNQNGAKVTMNGADGNEYAFLIATYALCEAYGMTQSPTCGDSARKCLERIVRGQSPTGGWDYKINPQSTRDDLSFAGWALQALMAGKTANLDIEGLGMCIKKAIRCLKTRNFKNGGFTYTPGGHPTGLTATGCLAMQLLGYGGQPEVAQALDYMRDWQPSFESAQLAQGQKSPGSAPQYYCYYATQCKYQAGMKAGATKADEMAWQKWNLAMKKLYSSLIIDDPEPVKDWSGKDHKQGHFWNKDAYTSRPVMDTCLAALQLMVYYRYPPNSGI